MVKDRANPFYNDARLNASGADNFRSLMQWVLEGAVRMSEEGLEDALADINVPPIELREAVGELLEHQLAKAGFYLSDSKGIEELAENLPRMQLNDRELPYDPHVVRAWLNGTAHIPQDALDGMLYMANPSIDDVGANNVETVISLLHGASEQQQFARWRRRINALIQDGHITFKDGTPAKNRAQAVKALQERCGDNRYCDGSWYMMLGGFHLSASSRKADDETIVERFVSVLQEMGVPAKNTAWIEDFAASLTHMSEASGHQKRKDERQHEGEVYDTARLRKEASGYTFTDIAAQLHEHGYCQDIKADRLKVYVLDRVNGIRAIDSNSRKQTDLSLIEGLDAVLPGKPSLMAVYWQERHTEAKEQKQAASSFGELLQAVRMSMSMSPGELTERLARRSPSRWQNEQGKLKTHLINKWEHAQLQKNGDVSCPTREMWKDIADVLIGRDVELRQQYADSYQPVIDERMGEQMELLRQEVMAGREEIVNWDRVNLAKLVVLVRALMQSPQQQARPEHERFWVPGYVKEAIAAQVEGADSNKIDKKIRSLRKTLGDDLSGYMHDEQLRVEVKRQAAKLEITLDELAEGKGEAVGGGSGAKPGSKVRGAHDIEYGALGKGRGREVVA